MRFIDEAQIEVAAGHGGAGSRHFRREKFVPLGGPDGGNGGDGGSVIIVADRNRRTLLDFRYNRQWHADNGKAGGGRLKDGKKGDDLEIPVPMGTQIFDGSGTKLLADLVQDEQRFIVARGGRGGKGNAFFKTATNRAPEHSQPGEPGESTTLLLSLKLVADVGLIGFPNAGKSTLISRISDARPKIADYPFTTLTPNLGVVRPKYGQPFVAADIPGLIPDAHRGKGLGVTFLKHIERTRVLAHLIDPFALDENGDVVDPIKAYELIRAELHAFSPELEQRPEIVVLTKVDACADPEQELSSIRSAFMNRGLECMLISSARGDGLDELVTRLAAFLSPAVGEDSTLKESPGPTD